ncbi:hypothetical protein EVAR_75389_1 [Eumeta japonica]|uniref:Uncharacterized protein n=1 Tax=Eumeta variegata TaxID=151549 RepID=A0A4C1TL66_EUMVA|nr:hypothetical protein EVAR_75389_1 [Eumeta japonica]
MNAERYDVQTRYERSARAHLVFPYNKYEEFELQFGAHCVGTKAHGALITGASLSQFRAGSGGRLPTT